MKIFVPHYTCKNPLESGIVCVKVITDYLENSGIYEKKINDLSLISEKVLKKIFKDNPIKMPISYDLVELFNDNYHINLFREKEFFKSDFKGINKYEKVKKNDLKNFKENISLDIETDLINSLKNNIAAVFVDFNKLYSQQNLGVGWVLILEYNELNREFIIYDPLYYTRLPKSRNFHRLMNTPKRRYITFNKGFFLKSWNFLNDLAVFDRSNKKNIQKPFFREFFTVTKSNMCK